MEQPVKDAIRLFERLDRSHSIPEAFDAFLELAFCALAKKDPTATQERRDALEARYMAEVKRWKPETIREFPKVMGMAFGAVTRMDFLGVLSAELGVLRAEQGQFFTPWELCRLNAAMLLGDARSAMAGKGYLTLDEPACGAGAMVLAAVEHLSSMGFNPTTTCFVRATDLSSRAYKMAFIQLSLAGVAAQVIHGNSLSLEVIDVSYTPGFRDFFEVHGHPFHPETKPALVVRKRSRTNAA